jgi:hypothetical protein
MSIAKVETFCLDDLQDKEIYEKLLNRELREEILIVKDKFDYDKMGRARITVWWHEENEEVL